MDRVEEKMLFPAYAVSNYYNQPQAQAQNGTEFALYLFKSFFPTMA